MKTFSEEFAERCKASSGLQVDAGYDRLAIDNRKEANDSVWFCLDLNKNEIE